VVVVVVLVLVLLVVLLLVEVEVAGVVVGAIEVTLVEVVVATSAPDGTVSAGFMVVALDPPSDSDDPEEHAPSNTPTTITPTRPPAVLVRRIGRR
jgi:hypothetical protein